MPSIGAVPVVTAFVARGREILVLRRSAAVGSYRGKWAGVSGFLEDSAPEARARIELAEELGLGPDDVDLAAAGEPLLVEDPVAGRSWMVHPFLFFLRGSARPRLDWEHVEMRWIEPERIAALDSVPGLLDAWNRVAFALGRDRV